MEKTDKTMSGKTTGCMGMKHAEENFLLVYLSDWIFLAL